MAANRTKPFCLGPQAILFLLVLSATKRDGFSFSPPISPLVVPHTSCGRGNAFTLDCRRPSPQRVPESDSAPNTSLLPLLASLRPKERPFVSNIAASAAPFSLSLISPFASRSLRRFILLGAALALATNLRRILWPGASPDRSHSEPLPPGSLGCPFVGMPFFIGSRDFGAGHFYRKMSRLFGNTRTFKYYFMGKPFVAISGGRAIKEVLNREFEAVISAGDVLSGGLMPMDSVLLESDKSNHSFFRRLVGSALTPAAVTDAVPTLQAAAEKQVERILESPSSVKMEDICTDYTLDVAWRQILGLNLAEGEIPVFQKAVEDWIKGIMSVRTLFRIAVKSSPGYKARTYVESKIKEKIQQLKRDGPDSSTLSGMLFATDEEDSSRRLSRQQVMDNSLILIFAGSETSAGTLTNAMLFLGLHPECWGKVVDEQARLVEKHGHELTKEALDRECPYLDAVVKESMRLRPLIGGVPRGAAKTIVVDGKQIPKGWFVDPSISLTHDLDPVTFKEDGSHMDPKLGFVPERWLSEETRPSENFVPFGAGPRYCLGANLANAEMRVFLAVLARKIDYRLLKEENIKWRRGLSVVPKPVDGVLISACKKGSQYTPSGNRT